MQIFYFIPTRQNVGLTSVTLGVVRALHPTADLAVGDPVRVRVVGGVRFPA